MTDRIAKVANALDSSGIDSMLVTNLTNVRYLTGFSGTNGQVLVNADGATFLSDPRYEERAHSLVSGADIVIYRERLADPLKDLVAKGRRLGIEGLSMTVAERADLSKRLDGVELIDTSGIVEAFRRVKDADEVAALKSAMAIGDSAFTWLLERLRVGVSERALALELEVHMRSNGAEGISFEPIIGSGPLSAHVHHTPSERELAKGDLVLMDFGCKTDGYCSDLTRTVVLGAATDEQARLYDLVLEAQLAAHGGVAAGVACADVDRLARAIIEDAGYGAQFGHGLGHGVGLDIHEAPRFHWTSSDVLEAGDVVTVEPGVYIKDLGGVRIEDCVLVTEQGAEILTAAPKDSLIEV